jgi:DNA-binding CsgD family transcriptional regulator/transposase
MAKLAAMRRSSEATRVSVAILAATSSSAADADQRRPDLPGAVGVAILETTLGALEAPALIVGQGGEIVCSNAAARAFIGNAPDTLRRPPPAAETVGFPSKDWEVSPIPGSGARAWSLMILRPAAVSPRHWNLTARQTEVLELLARGITNAAIAGTLGIAVGTVEFHIAAIFDKAGVNNRAALVASLIRQKRLNHLNHHAGFGTLPFVEETLDVTPGDRATLSVWLRSPNISSALAMRARIVLASGEGEGVREMARRLGTTVPTVCTWRRRYKMEGIGGLRSRKIPGRPKELTPALEQEIADLTHNPPAEVARWSAARLGRKMGVSESTILRIWRRHGLRPQRMESSKPDVDRIS